MPFSIWITPYLLNQVLFGIARGIGREKIYSIMTIISNLILQYGVVWLLISFRNLDSRAFWYGMIFSQSIMCVFGLGIIITSDWHEKSKEIRLSVI